MHSWWWAALAISIGQMQPGVAAVEVAGLTDSLSNATVGVLGQLGYDCQTASVGGILCRKCRVEDNQQQCEAFLCDAVTKKCRKKSVALPQLPNVNGNDGSNEDSGIKLPSF